MRLPEAMEEPFCNATGLPGGDSRLRLSKAMEELFWDATGLPGGDSRLRLPEAMEELFWDATTGLPGGGSRWQLRGGPVEIQPFGSCHREASTGRAGGIFDSS